MFALQHKHNHRENDRLFSCGYDYIDHTRLYDYIFWHSHCDISTIMMLMFMVMIIMSQVDTEPCKFNFHGGNSFVV